MIYLDNAATTFPKPEAVYKEMDLINRTASVNAGRGSYKKAREAAALIAETRQRLAQLFQCKGNVVFTPSVTHAINMILNGLEIDSSTNIYLTAYEHNAVARAVHNIRKKVGCFVEILPLNDALELDLEKARYLFHEKKPDIIISNVISNVTGYRLPVEELFALGKEFDAVTIADAAQAAGLIEMSMEKFSADIICFAGHKTLYGPLGIGGFALKEQFILKHTFAGGTGSNSLSLEMPENAPDRYEAASPNIVAIAGLNAALKILDQKEHEKKIVELTRYLLSRLAELPNLSVLGISDAKYGIVSFVIDGYDSNDIGVVLDEEFDIAVRTGYHCAPYIHDYIHSKECGGTVRIGIGEFNTEKDIDVLIEALETF